MTTKNPGPMYPNLKPWEGVLEPETLIEHGRKCGLFKLIVLD